MLQESIKVNKRRPQLISNYIKKIIKKKNIRELNLYGLTYKPDIDDFRESPALTIYRNLLIKKNLKINLIDPYIKKYQFNLTKRIKLFKNKSTSTKKNVLNILLVSHKKFLRLKNHKKVINLTN